MDARVPKTVAEQKKRDERRKTYQRIIGVQVSNITVYILIYLIFFLTILLR
jgi:hypothetical protein